jgi:hypothetical protein
MSNTDGDERVMSESVEPVDEGASTERGLVAGESFLEEILLVDEMVPLEAIVLLIVVEKEVEGVP